MHNIAHQADPDFRPVPTLDSALGIRADVEAAGATFVDKPVVVDGNLVTSRGWPDLPFFMPEFLRVVAEAAKASD